ncbi:hypothetical protein HNQ80_003362 [Anaerosolibacter carboniphilus]|uniref:Uncharacterized protein n=1 Tax=Anaerosolibacter carboniphilus TaxID=1417629 RepID=A0A841KV37_9FIRM|nr:hypothetical protein [Anaerosolibacter carboniphilus]MBB6217243.1 hypothetical protein [Anaerosolibacter carboniphilus]
MKRFMENIPMNTMLIGAFIGFFFALLTNAMVYFFLFSGLAFAIGKELERRINPSSEEVKSKNDIK